MNRNDRLFDALSLTARHQSEVSPEFIRGMAARMAVSMEKYGKVADSKLDALACLRTRVEKYLQTGNTEYLIDGANFLMMEFMKPSHRAAHFRATDSSESPGRTGADGQDLGQASNTASHENVRRGGSSLKTSGGLYRREGD